MSFPEQSSRILLAIAIILIIGTTLGLIGFNFFPLSAVPEAPVIQIQVNPNAIPVSGAWDVSTFLYYQNMTRFSTNSNITMTVTLADHGKTVQTKQTVNGEATFQVPSNTAGVRFDASYEGYTGSRAISGPTVYGELLALGFVSSGLLSGIAFVDGLPKWLNGIAPVRIVRRILFVALPVAALIFPISYLVFEEPGWYGTGWAPASMLGVPIYLAPLAPVALTLLRYAWPARCHASLGPRKRRLADKPL